MTFNEKGNMLTQEMLLTLSTVYHDFPSSNFIGVMQATMWLAEEGS